MDISTKAVRDTAPIHLKDAAGDYLYDDGKPVRIVVYGPGSRVFAEVEARQHDRALRRIAENDGKPMIAPLHERRVEEAQDLAALTVGFEHLSYAPAGDAQGVALFEAVYLESKLGFVKAQVSKFVADWGNFSPAAPTS